MRISIAAVCLFSTACLQRGIEESQFYAIEVSPSSAPADASSIVTATLSLANFSFPKGTQVTFRCSNAAGTAIAQPTGPDPYGRWVAQIRSSSPGVQDILAYAQQGNRTLFLASAQATFTALQASAATSTLLASPSTVSADGTTSTTLTLQARDALQHAVVAAPLTIAVTGSENFLANAEGVTDETGQFVTTLASTRAETKTITATLPSLTLSATATFSGTAPSQLASTFVALPTSVADDGNSPSTLTVTVRDAQNNILPGQAVTFSTGANWSATTGATDANG